MPVFCNGSIPPSQIPLYLAQVVSTRSSNWLEYYLLAYGTGEGFLNKSQQPHLHVETGSVHFLVIGFHLQLLQTLDYRSKGSGALDNRSRGHKGTVGHTVT